MSSAPTGDDRAAASLRPQHSSAVNRASSSSLPYLPLNALRAFEVAARTQSFARAADELQVTPAAVSQLVRTLENYLGIELFERYNRGVRLTRAGQDALPELTQGFENLSGAVHRLRGRLQRNIVTIRLEPSFAALWLLPKLHLFRTAHPEIDVRIWASSLARGQTWEGCDLAIKYRTASYPGVRIENFLTETVHPVCSPGYLARRGVALHDPADIPSAHLIHDEGMVPIEEFPTWRLWLDRFGATAVDDSAGLRFTQSFLTVQAALAGQGIALGRSVLVADEIAAGRLVRPFADAEFPVSFSYYLLTDERAEKRTEVDLFRNWLRAEGHNRS
jgi:LysR family glycine cleavage system transcriptional activator